MTQKKSLEEVYFEIKDRFKVLVEKHGQCETVHDFIDRFCTKRDEDRPADIKKPPGRCDPCRGVDWRCRHRRRQTRPVRLGRPDRRCASRRGDIYRTC
jgi:hypothetical protein